MNTTKSPVKAKVLSLLKCLLPGAAGLAVILLARVSPEATERLYARGVFPLVSQVTRLLALPPFSMAGLLLLSGALFVLAMLVRLVVLLFKRRDGILFGYIKGATLILSLILLAFALTCAPNYYRLTFTELSGLSIRPSSPSELSALCAELIERANALRPAVSADGGVTNGLPGGFRETAARSREAFDTVCESYPFVGRSLVTPKAMPLSELLSYFKLTGFYFSYTGEANVNAHMPPLELGFTMCHELAHTRGFMREDEANFIAYLACRGASSPEVAYSGAVCALNHSMSALYGANPDLYYALRATYSEGLNADLADMGRYWSRYETPVATVSNAVNDLYLRANDQSDGTRSYGRMVDLLLADYRARHEIT